MGKKRPLALVTGASRGIGEAIARRLAAEGYDLVLTARSSMEDLEKVAADIREKIGCSVMTRKVDASIYEEVEALFTQIASLDVLVNNAGISHVGLLMDMTPAQWDNVLANNLSSMFYTSKLAIPKMLHAGGKILNVSSVWGNVGASMEVAYSASKGGVNSFTKALAKELAPSGIAVNAIAYGMVDTQMNACFSREEKEEIRRQIPADRIATCEEAAEAACRMLQSPNYVTGQILTMDGGWT